MSVQQIAKISIDRRLFLGLGATLLTSGGSWAQEAEKPAELVVNSSGGVTSAAMYKAYFDEYATRYGIKIKNTSPADTSKLRAMVSTGNVEWDVTEISDEDTLFAARSGLLEPIDKSIVDLSNYPPEFTANEFLFPRTVYSTILGYRTGSGEPKHPQGWKQFWDVNAFPGRRALRNDPIDNLEFALLAAGVPKEKLYPLDVDQAFAKLDEIKPHISVWWTAGAQPAQLLLDGEVDFTTGWNGRFFDLIKKGAPVHMEWGGAAIKRSDFAIPKGAPNLFWSQKLLALMTEPRLQAVYANELGYPGLDPRSNEFVEESIRPFLPTEPSNLAKQYVTNKEWWADNGLKMRERWNRWMLG